jgi:hypothetical protein
MSGFAGYLKAINSTIIAPSMIIPKSISHLDSSSGIDIFMNEIANNKQQITEATKPERVS